MKEFLKRHRSAIVSFVVLTLPLFLLYLHGKKRESFLETGLMALTAPVQRLASNAMAWIGDLWSGYIALVGVREENEELRKKIEKLEGLILEGKRFSIENQRLKSLCEFKRSRSDLKTVAARVISKEISSYFRVVRVYLDVGEPEGIADGMPVITALGVVGRIERVSGHYADVMLTVDTRSHIDVKIAGKGVSGVLQGKGDRNAYGARFSYLHSGKAIEKNDTVVTTGQDRVFPPGLEVGYIESDQFRQDGMFYEFDVTPAVNFSILEEVLIVTSPIEAPPGVPEAKKP